MNFTVLLFIRYYFNYYYYYSVSYTTNDMVFDWEEDTPLMVEKNIELPQHDLIEQQIGYCTTIYSSGNNNNNNNNNNNKSLLNLFSSFSLLIVY